ncbi:flagellar export chaperone FliS [Butyrivibrio sp. AE2032]|uniref:flagellar export chaperone FliS n=1 Tax=Butyrivibrio sp. AE2032 TaxID=1458463 RepID=UPI0005530F98|nr:flagellar protein FliS [Butyrivibrio sp. AE2032]
MTLEKKQEFTLKISQANKTQMITIIYEMVMGYLEEAIDEIGIGKKDAATRSLLNAQNCIDELIRSLNLDYELARNLHQIYIFSKKELIAAGASYSIHRIWRVLKNFRSLHEAYRELEKFDNSQQLMGNTQQVYAGLTYGKHSLNEDIRAVSMNRGLMA